MTFPLRDVRMADLEVLYRIDQACFETGIAYSRAELRRYLSLSTAQAIAAEFEGSLAGFVIGHVSARRIGHVVTLDVLEDQRRQGVGRDLLSELLRRFSVAGVEEARLEVDMENPGAMAFYESFGFRKQRRLADYYGSNRPAWQMSLKLDV